MLIIVNCLVIIFSHINSNVRYAPNGAQELHKKKFFFVKMFKFMLNGVTFVLAVFKKT